LRISEGRLGLKVCGESAVELRTAGLKTLHIFKLQKKLIFCLLYFLLTTTAAAEDYSYESISADQIVPGNGEQLVELKVTEIPYWQFLLWLATIYVLSAVDFLYPKKLFFSIVGYRIVNSGNILENSSRFQVYTYIKTKPGAYISEIVEQIGLDREIVKYHLKALSAKRKIEAYKEGGKTRYFENLLVYNEDEKKVISALQNLSNQRIILEIITQKCNTNVDLAREFGVSRPTISWHMKNLKEVGLIVEIKEGKKTIYRINPEYEPLIVKHIQESQGAYGVAM
jgi:predicted transcriptional regulator